MDQLIQQFANVGFNHIGAAGNGVAKRNIVVALRTMEAPLFAFDQLRVPLDNIDELNNYIIRVRNSIVEAYSEYGFHGSINVGLGYANYNAVRDEFTQIFNDMTASDIGPEYKQVLRWILFPIRRLPAADIVRPFDEPRGEKTYSKMVLNLCVKLILERLEFSEGYLTCYQAEDDD